MKKSMSRAFAGVLSTVMLLSVTTGCGDKKDTTEKETTEATQATEADGQATSGDTEAVDTSATDVSEDEIEAPDGYKLVWHDEFNGTELSEAD